MITGHGGAGQKLLLMTCTTEVERAAALDLKISYTVPNWFLHGNHSHAQAHCYELYAPYLNEARP